ncbi:hypothetical protein HZB00_03930 [Candidatus Woesearchaeota archaeon]|nr:hypothetical protein [Candidatus Woesearchaeota archaeon]
MAEKPQAAAQVQEKAKPEAPAIAVKKKKKKWVPILATEEFNGALLGETYVEEADLCKGKVIETNLMMLTNDPKKQNMKIKFEVYEVKNNQAYAKLNEFELLVAHIKRITKKAKSKVDDSFTCATKDGVTLRLKPLIITKTKSHHSILTNIQNASRAFLTDFAKNNMFQEIMRQIITGDLAKELKNHVKKYHAITGCMIRVAKKEI